MADANADLSAWLRASAAECRAAAATVSRVESDLLMKRATRYEILAEDVEMRGSKPDR